MEEHSAASSNPSAHTDPNHAHPSSASRASPEPATLASSQTSSPSSSLRFPKPEGSCLLAHWVTSSSTNAADAMQSSAVLDETSSLADSAYELISSTDGESQDGRGTDSLADSIAGSFDLHPRADDVHSLNGHDAAYDVDGDGDDDEDEDEDEDGDSGVQSASDDGVPNSGAARRGGRFGTLTRNTPSHSQLYSTARGAVEGDSEARRSSQADSIRYAEQALCNPSTQSLSTLDYDSSHGDISAGHTPLVHSIEFNEEAGVKVNLDKVSVKHTIREFTDAETTIIAANMGMTADPPKRLAATVRQTMSHHCLSTREPLRVLYVGSDAAYNDIMYKISSALLASAPPPTAPGRDAEGRHASTPGIYNIIPISSFGSAKVPEIDEIQLMGVSDYYIKVERCARAEETVYEGKAFPNDTVYSIELDSGRSHVSVFRPSGSTVNPRWMLPHVAVFYLSGNDDQQAETTRNAAWEFMTRHAVPSIFISHTQTFSRTPAAGRWQNFVEQAALHLCLESRDPSRPIAPERLPIDLGSFLNIDARQMNRNLAYLTGLQDKPKKRGPGNDTAGPGDAASIEGVFFGVLQSVRLVKQGRDPRPQITRAARDIAALFRLHILGLVASLFVTALISSSLLYSPLFSWPGAYPSQRAASLSPGSTLTALATTAPGLLAKADHPLPTKAASSLCSVPSITPTVTISFVTTKTVQVLVPEPASSQSQAPFGGFLTDGSHSQKRAKKTVSDTEIKSTGCSIQVYSSHEILVKVPSATKTQWLAKGAIDIDVWRGQKILKSKLSTSDEGIIIEVDRMDAFGVMNVSIVTTRRPKINETFAVDFGKPTVGRLFKAALSPWQDLAWAAAGTGIDNASQAKKAIAAYANSHITVPDSTQAVIGNTTRMVHSLMASAGGLRADVASGYNRLRASDTVETMVQGAQSLIRDLPLAKDWVTSNSNIRSDIKISVLRAQVASKLWWLHVQGKTREHDVYEAKAAKYVRELELAAEAANAKHRKGGSGKRAEKARHAMPARPMAWFW